MPTIRIPVKQTWNWFENYSIQQQQVSINLDPNSSDTSLNGHVATLVHECTSLWIPSHTRQVGWGTWKKIINYNELLSLFVIFFVKNRGNTHMLIAGRWSRNTAKIPRHICLTSKAWFITTIKNVQEGYQGGHHYMYVIYHHPYFKIL